MKTKKGGLLSILYKSWDEFWNNTNISGWETDTICMESQFVDLYTDFSKELWLKGVNNAARARTFFRKTVWIFIFIVGTYK